MNELGDDESESPKTLEDFWDVFLAGICAIVLTLLSCLFITSYFESVFDYIREIFNGQ